MRLIIFGLIFWLAICLIDSISRADPYLVYSPTPKILSYQIQINGEVQDVEPNVVLDNKNQLVYDLKNVPVGASIVRARARYEVWGWCEWSDPFTVIRPSKMEAPVIMSNPPPPLPLDISPADGIR